MACGILLVTHPGVGAAILAVATALLRHLPLKAEAFEVPFDADLEALAALGLSLIVDLRRPNERTRSPSRRWNGFAAEVIENDEGETMKFRIVGYDEIYGRNDYISIDSPMARALLKKEEGDEVVVHTPTGEATWYVSSIRYGQGVSTD